VPALRTFGLFTLLLGCSDYELNRKVPDDPAGIPEPGFDTANVTLVGDLIVDSWVLEPSDGIDIVVFGDTSGSMADELITMGGKVTEFINGLNAYTTAWQLIVVTGPTGCNVGGILTNETADYAATFATAITTPPGVDDEDEWGLYNVATALEAAAPGGCNEGFLRPLAPLHAIFISDEDDNSPGYDDATRDDYWQEYLNRMLETKASADQLRMSAITGPIPGGCVGAEPGWGYTEAVGAQGGALLSICEAWYEQIDMLVDASVQRPNFPLSRPPLVDTLEVRVNDLPRTEGWRYLEEGQAVRFEAEIPVTGDLVEISYLPAG